MKTYNYTLNGQQLAIRIDETQGAVADILLDGAHPAVPDNEMPAYAAVIALALLEHEVEIVHDEETGVITLAPHASNWGDLASRLAQQ